jgi:hypothetical protein
MSPFWTDAIYGEDCCKAWAGNAVDVTNASHTYFVGADYSEGRDRSRFYASGLLEVYSNERPHQRVNRPYSGALDTRSARAYFQPGIPEYRCHEHNSQNAPRMPPAGTFSI